jgi:hypothetical protein
VFISGKVFFSALSFAWRKGFMAGFAPASASPTIFRRASTLVIPAPGLGQLVILPPPCVRCGAPADGKPVEKTFSWHHPAVYLAILAGLLIYVVLAVVIRKSIKVRVPLCARHAQRRSLAVTLAWVLPLAGIADAIILSQFDSVNGGIVALITIALVLAGLIIWAVAGNPIRPSFIDQNRGEFTGFCDVYLQQFPEGIQLATNPSQVLSPPSGTPPPPPIA